MGKGQLYAAQFCYIVSAVEFGTYAKKSSKVSFIFDTSGHSLNVGSCPVHAAPNTIKSQFVEFI